MGSFIIKFTSSSIGGEGKNKKRTDNQGTAQVQRTSVRGTECDEVKE